MENQQKTIVSLDGPVKVKTGCLSNIIYFIIFSFFVTCAVQYFNTRNTDKQNTNITYDELNSFINNESLTQIQRDDQFTKKFYDKKVTWAGNLISAEKQTFGYKVSFGHTNNTVVVEMNDSNGSKLLNINKNTLVRYSGVIDNCDGINYNLTNGEIIEIVEDNSIVINHDSITVEQENEMKKQMEEKNIEPTQLFINNETDAENDNEGYLNITYSDFVDNFKNLIPKSNRESIFYKEYRGKSVRWNGTLVSYEEKYSGIYYAIFNNCGGWGSISLKINDTNEIKNLLSKKLQTRVAFSGILKGFEPKGNLNSFPLEDGKILDDKYITNTNINTNKVEQTSITYKMFSNLFGINSKLTDIQKKVIFNNEYKGKCVVWEGVVENISEDFDVLIKHNYNTFTFDVLISFSNQEEINKLLNINIGSIIKYGGILENYEGVLLPTHIINGKIFEIKNY